MPVKQRVTYKMVMLTFKVLSSSTPAYLNDLIQPASPVRPLRSSDAPLLSAASTQTEFAQRAFSVAVPHTWNSLTSAIRSCHTLHTFKNTSKHTCSDNLNLKPPAPLYPLQDFKALYKYCIIIVIHSSSSEMVLVNIVVPLSAVLTGLLVAAGSQFFICFLLPLAESQSSGTWKPNV